MRKRTRLLAGIIVLLVSTSMIMSQSAAAYSVEKTDTKTDVAQTQSTQQDSDTSRAEEAAKAKEKSQTLLASPKSAPTSPVTADEIKDSLDNPNITSVDLPGGDSGGGIAVDSANYGVFPTAGKNYLVLSTGLASDVFRGTASDLAATNLDTSTLGADGNDMSQVRVTLTPPSGASCLAFDFQFMSEEYPEYLGKQYNDIFTAELNESKFELNGNQVSSPYNFAFDTKGKPISINTVDTGWAPNNGWGAMNGTTDSLTATTPITKDTNGNMTVILSIQDIGDSIYDSAALIDNFHWLNQVCDAGVSSQTDTDGDGLYDDWETKGIDYDNNGTIDLDLPAMGADPYKPDIFVEADWMVRPSIAVPDKDLVVDGKVIQVLSTKSYQPTAKQLKPVYEAFAKAPVVTTSKDGKHTSHGINLHVDAGPDSVDYVTGKKWKDQGGSGANAVPYDYLRWGNDANHFSWKNFDSIKQFDNNRKRVFHYVIFGTGIYNDSGEVIASGVSRSLGGGDNDSSGRGGQDFYIGAGYLYGQQFHTGDLRLDDGAISRTFMHELGHNLGLDHGGGDDTNYKPNYISIMNYDYQLKGLLTAKKNPLQLDTIDYSGIELPELDEHHLDEEVGIDSEGWYQNTGLGASWVCRVQKNKDGQIVARDFHEQTPIAKQYVDFNCNNNIKWLPERSVVNDIDGNGRYGVIHGYNDWKHLVYRGGLIGSPGDVNVQLPETTSVNEMSGLEAIEQDLLAVPGTAHATVVGPYTVIKGVQGQKLFVNVENMSHEADDFTVKVSGDVFDSPETQKVHVNGSTTLPLTSGQVSFLLKADVNEGDHSITVTVTGSTGKTTEQTATVNVISLSDADRQNLLDVLRKGDTGLPDIVAKQYLTALSSTATPSDKVPNTGDGADETKRPHAVKQLSSTGTDVMAAITLALLCVVIGVTAMALRRKSSQQ